MSILTQFQFESNDIRFVEVRGEPWVVALDILRAMDSKTKVTDLKTMVENDLGDEFVSNEVVSDNLGRGNEMLVISEAALTLYLSRSRTELGKKMNRWIHTEVLPSIRKTGSYTGTPITPEPTRQLPPVRDSIDYSQAAIALEHSRLPHALKQLLLDKMGDELCTQQKALPAASPDIWMGVAQRAEELKYQVDSGIRSKLGKYVSKQFSGDRSICGMIERKREERLCNGTMRGIWVYQVCDALDILIHRFFNVQ